MSNMEKSSNFHPSCIIRIKPQIIFMENFDTLCILPQNMNN